MIACTHPWWLLLALALALVAGLALWTTRRRSWRWCTAGVLLPAIAAICIALALAQIRIAAAPRVVLLLDFSASTRSGPPAPWRDPAYVRQLAERRLGPAQHLTVAAFAGNDVRILLPDITPADSWPARFDWDDSSGPAETDFARALAWRTDREDTTHPAARWLITDGLATWRSTGIPAEANVAITVIPPTSPDAALRDFVVRPAADDPATLELLIQARVVQSPASAALTAQLEVRRDGQLIAHPTIDFPPTAGYLDVSRWLTLRDRPPANAAHHYTATIHLPADAWPQNDTASAIWPGTNETPRLLVIGREKPPSALPMSLIPADQFSQTAAQLVAEGCQIIILNDVPSVAPPMLGDPSTSTPAPSSPPSLPPAAPRELDRFVRQTGGGLLILARGHAFGPGHWGEQTPDLLEDLSPVASRPPVGGNTRAIFLLDASASMNEPAPGTAERKFTLLSHAVEEALCLLAPRDRLTLITFNRQARIVADGPLQSLTDVRQKLAAVQVGGETSPDCALPDLTAALTTPARHLVFLITDGEIPVMDIPQWKNVLTAPSAHLFVIAPAGSPSLLQQLATAIPDATWSHTADPSAWADTLHRLVADQVRGAFQTAPPAPLLQWHTADDPPSTINRASAWTITWPKPESIHLADELPPLNYSGPPELVPVAAVAQRGLGKIAAITLADLSSAPAQELFQRSLKNLTPSPGDRRFAVIARPQNDGTWLVQADGIDTLASPHSFLDGQSLFLRPLDRTQALPLSQTAPGHYEARISAPQGLSAIIFRQTTSPGSSSEQLVTRVQSAAVQTTEWPATAPLLSRADLPPHTPILSSSLSDSSRWPVPPDNSFSLTPALWLAGALAALAALWLRY